MAKDNVMIAIILPPGFEETFPIEIFIFWVNETTKKQNLTPTKHCDQNYSFAQDNKKL